MALAYIDVGLGGDELNYISFIFLVFLIGLLAVYVLTPNRFKWTVLLLFSLIFYVYSGVDKLLFMLGTSLVVYFSAFRMQKIWQEYGRILEMGGAKFLPQRRNN